MTTHAIQIKNLSKQYPNGVQALKDVSFYVKQGDFFALLGKNGAGKSTLISILCSIVKKTSGTILINNFDLEKNPSLAKKQLGVVPQEFNFSIFETIETILLQQAGFYGVPKKIAKIRAEKYLKLLDLWPKRHLQARTLSGGMKRRLMIARALMHEPRILILDEPTAGVDVELRQSMWQFLIQLNKEGITIILTTHYLEEAEALCQTLGVINQGKMQLIDEMKKQLRQVPTQLIHLELQESFSPHERQDLENQLGEQFKFTDAQTLSVSLKSNESLNSLFTQLSNEKIMVQNVSGQSSRLESIFMRLTQ